MKNRKLLIGTAATAIIASAFLVSQPKTEGLYNSRITTNTNPSQGIHGAFDYMAQIKKNLETGTVNQEDWLRMKHEAEAMPTNRADVNWKEHGPDNVGGRTRAILINKDDVNLLYAGSVSGGLFKSINRGSTWSKVDGFSENLAVSSICQTDDGKIYVATGHSEEQVGGSTAGYDSGANGLGAYVSADNGETFTLISGTNNYIYINEVVAHGNNVFLATNSGLKKYDGSSVTSISGVSGSCKALSISEDGTLIIASGTSSKAFVSTDGGESFTDVSGSINSGLLPQGAGRIEFAISHEKVNDKYYVYCSQANANLKGIYKSIDNGFTWTEIAPANNGTVGSFAPFNSGGSGQGLYDNIITVVKGDPETCLLGGINIHAKSTTGNWETRSNGFYEQTSPLYVHSDQHEMQWDSEGRLWLGNDGGIFFSDDQGNSFRESNRNYNVTQFYKIGFSAHGDVIGGAQDNGTQANYHTNHTYREHDAVGGGDGFGCAMSFINRDILFSTVYYGAINRSSDRGESSTAYSSANITNAGLGTPGSLTEGLGSFNTCIELFENPNDLNSTDSVIFTYAQSYAAGDVIQIPSKTSGVSIEYTTPTSIIFQDTLVSDASETTLDTVVTDLTGVSPLIINVNTFGFSFINGAPSISLGDSLLINNDTIIVDEIGSTPHFYGTNSNRPGQIVDMKGDSIKYNIAWDLVKVQDPYQSWFAFGLGNGEGVWLTRNALRLSAPHDGFLLAGSGMGGVVTTMEFSVDGNHLFIGTSAGQVWRLSGLAGIYSPNSDLQDNTVLPDTLLNFDTPHYATTFTQIENFGAYVTNLSSDKQDEENLVVTLGNYGGSSNKVNISNDAATSVDPSFSSIMGNLPNGPYYSCVIDRNDDNLIFVGNDFGVYQTENGGTTWENVSGDFGNVPVWDMGQNWRTWNEGCYKPGEIYIGTHGRGIWSTDAYLGIEEAQDNLEENKFKTDFLVYPNPVNSIGNVYFELTESSDVTLQVYNLSGQVVRTIKNNNMAVGANTIQFDAIDLPKGTYFIRVSGNDLLKTTKFIKY